MSLSTLLKQLQRHGISARNATDFALRHHLGWGRSHFVELAEPKHTLWDNRPDHARLQNLQTQIESRYDLVYPYEHASQSRYKEILTQLHYLEHILALEPTSNSEQPLLHSTLEAIQRFWQQRNVHHTSNAKPLRWLDVGCGNFAYGDALYQCATTLTGQHPTLVGIELDGNRLYTDLHRRKDYGKAFTSHLDGAIYRVDNVMNHTDTYDVVSCFLPFVFEDPLLDWGLPLQFFNPGRFLHHLHQRVNPGGLLIIVNQDHDEYEIQGQLFSQWDHHQRQDSPQELPWQRWDRGELPTSFLTWKYPRFGWCSQRPQGP